jgi:hypothetical protein
MADIIKIIDKKSVENLEEIESNVTKSKELLSKYIVSRLLDADLMLTEEERKQIKLGEDKEKLDNLINSFKNDNTYLYKIYTYLNNLEAQSMLSKENNKEIKQVQIPNKTEPYSIDDAKKYLKELVKKEIEKMRGN